MKCSFIVIGMLLDFGSIAHAQYIYWNNDYEEVAVGQAAGTKLFLDTVQSNFRAIGGSWDGINTGFEMRTLDGMGLDLGEIYVPGPEPSSGAYGFGNQLFAKTLENGYVYCSTATFEDCEYGETAVLHKINSNFSTDWYKKFDLWHTDCSSWSGSSLVKVMPDGRIFLLSYHYIDDDTATTATWDHTGWRFTTLDTDGNILTDSLHVNQDNLSFWYADGVVLDNDTVLLAGSVSFNPFMNVDNQIALVKISVNDGTIGTYYSYPGSDGLETTTWPTTALKPNGQVNVSYQYCEDQDGLDWMILTPHLMLFDPIDMQPVWDNEYQLPEWQDTIQYIRSYVTQSTSDGGTISALDKTEYDWDVTHFLLKTDASGELDWCHQYFPPYINDNTDFNHIYDIIETPDSTGYVITGEVSDENWVPHHWMFRIDPCGDLVWNNCGVGVMEQEQKSEVVVYPNPATGNVFNVECSDLMSRISIIDISGRMVLSETTTTKQKQVDVSFLANGLYTVQVQLDNGIVVTQRVVVE